MRLREDVRQDILEQLRSLSRGAEGDEGRGDLFSVVGKLLPCQHDGNAWILLPPTAWGENKGGRGCEPTNVQTYELLNCER